MRRRSLSALQDSTRTGVMTLCALAGLFLPGCQLIGGRSGEAAGNRPSVDWETGLDPVEGEIYQGHLEMEGSRVQAALQLVRVGTRRVRGAFQGASGLVADGEGVLRGESLSLRLTYGGECPGRMDLEGVWDRSSKVYEGTVEASDCTGRSSGTFRFSAT